MAKSLSVSKPCPSTANWFKKWSLRAVVLGVFCVTCSWLDSIKVSSHPLDSVRSCLNHLVQDRWYVLDPPFLHELAREAIAASPGNTEGMIQHIVTNLASAFPQPSNQIALNTNSSEWVFNNAGGAMGAMYIIHASITEYLIIFGTPLGTEGHTGLHTADDYFHILVGEQWAFRPGALEMEKYKPGDVHLLPRGTAKQYKMHEGCFAMEYARGKSIF